MHPKTKKILQLLRLRQVGWSIIWSCECTGLGSSLSYASWSTFPFNGVTHLFYASIRLVWHVCHLIYASIHIDSCALTHVYVWLIESIGQRSREGAQWLLQLLHHQRNGEHRQGKWPTHPFFLGMKLLSSYIIYADTTSFACFQCCLTCALLFPLMQVHWNTCRHALDTFRV